MAHTRRRVVAGLAALAAGTGAAYAVCGPAAVGASAPNSATVTAVDFDWSMPGATDYTDTIAAGGTVTFSYPAGVAIHNVDFTGGGPTACTQTAGAGVIVTAPGTGATTTTNAQGQFTLETGSVGGMIVTVGAGSTTTVPTIVRVDVPGSQVTIPVVNANDLTGLETGLGTVVPDGTGIVALHLVDVNGAGAVGYTVTPPPGTTEGPFYDDQTSAGFSQNGATGAAGTALLFGVPQGNVDLGVSGATQDTISNVAVFPGALTFANGTVGTP